MILRRRELFAGLDATYVSIGRGESLSVNTDNEDSEWACTLQDDMDSDEVWSEDGRLVSGD
jgi:hypothetical protein